MRKALLFSIMAFAFVSCGVQSEFVKSSNYVGKEKPSSVFLIVVGDHDNRECLEYYKDYLSDSLQEAHVKVESSSDYRVDKKNNDLSFVNQLISENMDHPYILTTVLTEAIVGYGASSSRTLKLALISSADRKVIWSGELVANFSWFRSDNDYRKVALNLAAQAISELRLKAIVRR